MSRRKEKGKRWDGRSRIPTAVYKHNYNEIFRNKIETNHETNKNIEDEEYLKSLQKKL
tara:strand:- start:186 stop:359 length:174 start_codon:yes stop_codon:yes gene_type:complete